MNLRKIKLITLLFLFGMIFSAITMPVLALNPDKNYPSDLLAFWRFDDRLNPTFQQTVGVGLISDETAYNNFGELEGDARLTIDGKFDDAVEFDGSGDYIKVSNNPVLNQTVFTILLWINFDTLTPSQIIMGKTDGSVAGWVLFTDTSVDEIQMDIITTDGIFTSGFDYTPLSTDTWYYLGITYDGTKISLYLDGEIKDSEVVSGDLKISSETLRIGDWGNVAKFWFDGRMDDIAIYNRSLSEAEILDRYTNGIPEEEIPFDWTTLILPLAFAGGITVAILWIFLVARKETGAMPKSKKGGKKK